MGIFILVILVMSVITFNLLCLSCDSQLRDITACETAGKFREKEMFASFRCQLTSNIMDDFFVQISFKTALHHLA